MRIIPNDVIGAAQGGAEKVGRSSVCHDRAVGD
jgi:hypothetical protein